MNKTIKELNKRLAKCENDQVNIQAELQQEWNKVFDDCSLIPAMVSKVQDSGNYTHNEYGDICSYTHVDLSKFKECKEYFKNYMQENHFVDVDFLNDALIYSHGPDNFIIQDDSRHSRDNGVWCEHKLIIPESEYKNDGDVNETKRNELIEAYMERTGFFPGVFRIDYYGNIFLVNTKAA